MTEKRKPPRHANPTRPKPQKEANADEVLREQSKTETEERPYLDTEGGE